MRTPDKVLKSFNGPFHNGMAVRISELLDGSLVNDTIKCSTGLEDFTGEFGTVISGNEDGADINNLCKRISLRADLWVLRNCSMGFTVKGGVWGVKLFGTVQGHGRECDVDIGNASDQSHVWVTDTFLDLRQKDGSPMRVRVLAGDYPVYAPGSGPYELIFPGNIKWSPCRRFITKCFLQYRRTFQK